jgi:hypothetical protein
VSSVGNRVNVSVTLLPCGMVKRMLSNRSHIMVTSRIFKSVTSIMNVCTYVSQYLTLYFSYLWNGRTDF